MSDSGTLTVYERMSDPLEAVKVLGTAIAKSGMFGCGTIEQGQVFALECLARRMPPLTLAERFHVVQGRLMMKYDAMLAEFHALGGRHKIISRTEDKAEIELSIDGETHRESLTWDQAKGEKWPFAKDGKTIKDNWASPRARRQMLWARVVSEGVRALRPGVNNGHYVAEEIEDVSGIVSEAGSNGHAKPAQPSVVAQAEAAAKQAAIDVPFETKAATEVPPPAEPAAQPPQQAAPLSYDEQPACVQMRQGIEEMFVTLGMTVEQQQAALAKRGVNSLRSLTNAQGAELMGKLKEVFFAREKARQQTPVEPGNEPVYSCSGQCTVEQEQRIKAALTEWAQINNAEYTAEMTAFKQKLVASGRQKILDLSANDAARLYEAIQSRKLASFCQRSLEQWKPKEATAATS